MLRISAGLAMLAVTGAVGDAHGLPQRAPPPEQGPLRPPLTKDDPPEDPGIGASVSPWEFGLGLDHRFYGLWIKNEILRSVGSSVHQFWWLGAEYRFHIMDRPVAVGTELGLSYELTLPNESFPRRVSPTGTLQLTVDELVRDDGGTGIVLDGGFGLDLLSNGLAYEAGPGRGTLDPLASSTANIALWLHVSARREFTFVDLAYDLRLAGYGLPLADRVSLPFLGLANTFSLTVRPWPWIRTSYGVGWVITMFPPLPVLTDEFTSPTTDQGDIRTVQVFHPTLDVTLVLDTWLKDRFSSRSTRIGGTISVGAEALHPTRSIDNARFLPPLIFNTRFWFAYLRLGVVW